MDRSSFQRRTPGSVLTGLIWFAAALTLPVTLFIGFLLWQFASAERSRTIAEAQAAVANLAQTVDRDLAGLIAAADVLATSPSLQQDDIQEFQRRAASLAGSIGTRISVTRLDGSQIVNTAYPIGAELPEVDMRATDHPSFLSGRNHITDLVIDGEPRFIVIAPVLQSSEIRYFVHLEVLADRISRLLRKGETLPGATIGVVDRSGTILARNMREREFVGLKATDDLLQNTDGRRGTWIGYTKDGQAVFGAYARAALADWRVVIGVPEDQLEAPMRRTLTITVAAGAILALLSFLLAWKLGRRISRPLGDLAALAGGVGKGAATAPLASPVREVNEVSEALAAASRDLELRARQRDESARALQVLNDRLEEEVALRTRELEEEMRRRTESEDQIRQMQKLEALGQLTGGIAHDFNNMLTIIMGGLEMLRYRLPHLDARTARYLDSALEGTHRAADLTQRLLAFSRRQALSPKPVNVNRLVQGVSELLQRTIKEDVRIETVLASGLWHASADENQLENAILNLAVNGRDAIASAGRGGAGQGGVGSGSGRLTIETSNAFLDEDYALHHRDVAPGQYVMIAVSDTGEGMPPEIIEKAVEPFFTTKEPGKGTGLGLSQVYGFVKQSGGHLKIYSEPGEGTTVKVYLPRVVVGTDAPAPAPAALPLPRADADETILVVEDESLVRTYSVEALRELGYTVLEADGAGAALALLSGDARIDLLFTDIVMPDQNGRLLAEKAQILRPGLKVLYTTGFTRNAIVHNGVLDAGVELLVKPFSVDQLARKIRGVLSSG